MTKVAGRRLPKSRIAAQFGFDPKTVRQYLTAAASAGIRAAAAIVQRLEWTPAPLGWSSPQMASTVGSPAQKLPGELLL